MRAPGSGFRSKTIENIDLTALGALTGQDIFDRVESFSNLGIQLSWSGLTGTPTIKVESSINGVDFDVVVDSNGNDVEFTPTGASGSFTIVVSEFTASIMRLNITVAGSAGTASASLVGNN